MGISGLLPFLKGASSPVHVRDLKHQTAAIDVYCWLHKGAFGCAEKLVQGQPTNGYILYTMKFLDLLLAHHIKPVVVFDGRSLPSKAGTEKKRRENRAKYRKMAVDRLREGNLREARECFQRCIDITPAMAREVIAACQERNIDCIVAPHEADAQLAWLNTKGVVDFVITEDSDLTMFGCHKILFKLDMMGNGVLYQREHLNKCLGKNADTFTFEKFCYMCIMSGCDYLPSLHGIGLGKAFKFWNRVMNPNLRQVLPKIPGYLNMSSLNVTPEYVEGFIQASRTFRHQLVFDPKERKLRPLEPYPEHENLCAEDVPYAGEVLPQSVAFQLSLGNLDLNDLSRQVRHFDPDTKVKGLSKPTYGKRTNHDSIWNPDYDPKRTMLFNEGDSTTTVNSAENKQKKDAVKTAFGDFGKTVSVQKKRKLVEDDEDLFEGEEYASSTHLDKKKVKTSDIQKEKKTNLPAKVFISKYFAPKEETTPEIKEEENPWQRENQAPSPPKENIKIIQDTRKPGDWLKQLDNSLTPKGKFIYRTDHLDKDKPIDSGDQEEQSPATVKPAKARKFSPIKLGVLDKTGQSLRSTEASRKGFKPVSMSSQEELEEQKRKRNPFAKKKAAVAESSQSSLATTASRDDDDDDDEGKLVICSADSDSFRFTPKVVSQSSSSQSQVTEVKTFSSESGRSSYFSQNIAPLMATSSQPLKPGKGFSGLRKPIKKTPAKPKQKNLLDMWGKK